MKFTKMFQISKKNGIFPRSDKLDQGQKEKKQTVSRGVYKDVEVEDAGGHNFFTQSKTQHLEQYVTFRFCYRAATQLGFFSLRLLKLGNSPTALVDKTLTLL